MMQAVELAAMDLNLLVALDALLQAQSVTKAAQRVGLTTSAMSHALGRIREQLDDPILVRAGRSMVPTPRALALGPRLHTLLQELDQLLAPATSFDPATLTRSYRIRASDHVLAVLGPDLEQRMAATAPGVDLWFETPSADDHERVRDGSVDLALGVFPQLGPETRVQKLFDERFAVVVRRGHPSLTAGGDKPPRLGLREYLALGHVLVAPRGRAGGTVDEVLAASGRQRRVARAVPNFLAALLLVSGTDYVVTISEQLAVAMAQRFELEVTTPPIVLPRYAIVQAWHPRFEADPAHRFLRELINAAAKPLRKRAN